MRAWIRRDPWFHVSTGDGFYHHHRSWNDDLTVPFAALPRYIALVRAGKAATRPTEELRKERDRIAAEYRGLVPSDEERAAFDQVLGLCRLVFPYVEDHKFYCEHWFTTRFFQRIREFGALLHRAASSMSVGLATWVRQSSVRRLRQVRHSVTPASIWSASSSPAATSRYSFSATVIG